MLARLAPVLLLAVTVVQLGCARRPADVTAKPERRVVATAHARHPAVVELGAPDLVDAGTSVQSSSPPPATTFEKEAVMRDANDVTDYRKMARIAMAEKRPADAASALRIALADNPAAAVWHDLGQAYLDAGDAQRGIATLEEALAREPGLTDARRTLAKQYLAVEDGLRARLHAEELVRSEPLDASARQILGRAFMQQKMWNEAMEAFELVLKQEPDNIFAHNNIGYSALQVGFLQVARDHLERCLSLEPQQGYMLNNLGVTYERMGRAAEAHAAFSRAAELSPRYAQAKLNRDRLQAALTPEDRVAAAQKLSEMETAPIALQEEPLTDVERAVEAATR